MTLIIAWYVAQNSLYLTEAINEFIIVLYLQQTNPTVLNEYAAAVGYLFLTMVPETLAQQSEHGAVVNRQSLGALFNNPASLYLRDKLDATLR